jgi:hypothetical protein
MAQAMDLMLNGHGAMLPSLLGNGFQQLSSYIDSKKVYPHHVSVPNLTLSASLSEILYGDKKIIDEKDPEAEFAPWVDLELEAAIEAQKKEAADAKTRADMAVIMKIIEAGKVETIERSSLSCEDDYKISIISELLFGSKKIFYKNPPRPDGAQSFTVRINFNADEIDVDAIKSTIDRQKMGNEKDQELIRNAAGAPIGLSCKWENFDIVFSARENTRNFEASEAAAEVKKIKVKFSGEPKMPLWGDIPVSDRAPEAAPRAAAAQTVKSENWRRR